MERSEIERLIGDGIEDARATVSRPRDPDEEHEDDHYAAVVVSSSFEGESLVDQHQMVYDALEGHMTTDIHALELETYTPEEYETANKE